VLHFFIAYLGIYRRAGNTATPPPFLEDFEKSYNKQSQTVVANAGYGSEQNYEWTEEK
jgi:hypothetical protein